MQIATIGSRVFDDTIKITGNKSHNNALRVVGISLFSITAPDEMAGLVRRSAVEEENDYRRLILELDVNNTVVSQIQRTSCQAICLDFLDSGKELWECTLSDNRVIRCTCGPVFQNNLPLIRRRIEKVCKAKIKKEEIINPLLWSDARLANEVSKLVTLLKNILGERKIVLLQAHIPYQYTDGQDIINSPDYRSIGPLNDFCDRCVAAFLEQMPCISIPLNRFILGGEKYPGFEGRYYTEEFYEYLNGCIGAIENNTYDEAEASLRRAYEAKLYDRVETVIVEKMMFGTKRLLCGRKAVLISHSDKIKKVFADVHDIEISQFIPYEEAVKDGKLSSEILAYAGKNDEYAFIVPYFNCKDNLCEMLWEIGYPFRRDVLVVTHPNIRLFNFIGTYDDVFDNHYVCRRQGIDCYINGWGAVGEVAEGDRAPFVLKVSMETQTRFLLGKNVVANRLIIALVFGSECTIGERTTFAEECRIFPIQMERISIGRDCMFAAKVVCHVGDGHAIFDVNSGKRINWLPSTRSKGKLEIVLGDHIWVGYQSFILAGSHIGNGCIIGARSMVNKRFPNNCIIAGNPAAVVRRDIAWARDAFTKNIYENECILEEGFIQYTGD